MILKAVHANAFNLHTTIKCLFWKKYICAAQLALLQLLLLFAKLLCITDHDLRALK